MTTPPVTIGLPIYNAERFLAEALESIKAQTFGDFEVVAVLDAPTDRSEEILRDLADKRFRILKNERNLGLCRTLNEILRQASAPLLARFDADDVMLPERIAEQYAFLLEQETVDILGTACDVIDENGNHLGRVVSLPLDSDSIREAFRRMTAIQHPTVMYRKQRILDAGGYDPAFPYAEDLSLWMRCMIHGYRMANLPQVLLHYRQHGSQLLSTRLEETCAMTDLAYETYGRQIWGDRAPKFVAGISRWHRLRRRVKRIIRGIPVAEYPAA